MALAGTLEIEMLANIARITDDMQKVKSVVGGAMGDVSRSIEQAKSMLASLGVGLSAGYFGSLIKGSIDAADHLNDLTKSTHLSVEELAGLSLLAKQTGTDLDGLAKGVNRMSVEMGKNPEKFKALGVTATNNKEAFKQFADIFNLLPDINQRNALSNSVFGKSWAEMAPALAEGGKRIDEIMEKGAKLSGITKEMTQDADELNDMWAQLGGTGGTLTRQVAPLLPILKVVAEDLVIAQEKSAGAKSEFSLLAETMRPLIVLAGNFAFVWNSVGISIAGAFEQIDAFRTGGIEGFKKAREEIKKILDQERADLDAWEKKIMDAGKPGTRRAAPEDPAADPAKAAAAAAAAKAFLDAEKTAAADVDSVYRNLLKTLKEKLLTQQELNEVSKLQIALDAMSAKQREGMTPAMQAELKGYAMLVDLKERNKKATEAYIKTFNEQREEQEELNKYNAEQETKQHEIIASTQKIIEQMQFETALIGKSNVEREKAIALRSLETSGLDKQSVAYEQMRAKLAEAVGTKAAKEDAQREWESLWSSIENTGHDVFNHVFADGKSAFEGIGRAIKASIIDLLYQITVKRWFIQIGTSISGGMGAGSAGTGMAAGGGGGMNGLLQLGSSANDFMAGGAGLLGGSAAYAAAVPGLSFGGTQAAMLAAQTGEFGAAGLAMTAEAGGAAAGVGAGIGAAAAIPYVGLAIGALALMGAFDSGGADHSDPRWDPKAEEWTRPGMGNPRALPAGFDPVAYNIQNPDVAASGYASHPYDHYVNYGQAEGRKWQPDDWATNAQNPAVIEAAKLAASVEAMRDAIKQAQDPMAYWTKQVNQLGSQLGSSATNIDDWRAQFLTALDGTLTQDQLTAWQTFGVAIENATSNMAQAMNVSTSLFATLVDYTRYTRLSANGSHPQLPGFASGGYFGGGWRIVGEHGPEAEYTGASRIFNNTDTQGMFDQGGVVDELRAMRDDMRAGLEAIAGSNARMAKLADRWEGNGIPVRAVDPTEPIEVSVVASVAVPVA